MAITGIEPFKSKTKWGYRFRDAKGVLVSGLTRTAFAATKEQALKEADAVLAVAVASRAPVQVFDPNAVDLVNAGGGAVIG